LRAPHRGTIRHVKAIGDRVTKGETILYVDGTPVTASIDGILRGLIREIGVWANEKVGDVEPRGDISCCLAISDKANAIGGGVLEALMHYMNRKPAFIREQEFKARPGDGKNLLDRGLTFV